MKKVVVKKCKSHRTGVRWLFWSGFFLAGIACSIVKDFLPCFLILLPVTLGLVPLYVYFEDWTLTFTRDEIIRHCWGRSLRYSWNDIQEVTAARSSTDGEYIRIQLRDGKAFRFRLDDENAQQAVKAIQSHRSIKI